MPAMRPQSPPAPAAFSDEIALSFEDDDISLPSPISSSLESYGSSSDESDGGSAKKPRGPPTKRAWPSADEVALLEAVVAHRERNGRLPSPDDLVAALRGRLEVDAEQVGTRMETLRIRFIHSTRRLSRGVVPVSDDDLKILRLSRRIWKTGKRIKSRASASARHERRGFVELAGLYPCLASEVEGIEARRRITGTLKMAFGLIGDEMATELEAKVKKQRLKEIKVRMKLSEVKTEVATALLEFIE